MARQHKIHTLRAGRLPQKHTENRQSGKKLHPLVRKRRLFYLCWMALFLLWFVVELFIQQQKIWNQEEMLATKQKELAAIQQENATLQNNVKRLNSPAYLIELAHKLGYSKPEEENYQLESE
jgi:cell division protein DivIC